MAVQAVKTLPVHRIYLSLLPNDIATDEKLSVAISFFQAEHDNLSFYGLLQSLHWFTRIKAGVHKE